MSDKSDVEVVVSFDTTGSMYPCITQVRREIVEVTKTLFADIPNFRMGVIAHGDYCDERSTYVTKQHELTSNISSLVNFIRTCGNTGGGDAPECYELVLHLARSFQWTAEKNKVLVLIGDDVPHGAHESQNKKHLDWRNELKCLLEMGVKVYGVQALNRRHAESFYEEIAKITGGFKLDLDQFSEVVNLIEAICYRQVGEDAVTNFVNKVQEKGHFFSRTMVRNVKTLTGKEVKFKSDAIRKRYESSDLTAVPVGRFQVLDVDEDCSIREFVESNGLAFEKGRGFYEFTKSVKIQDYKEIILKDRVTGDMFQGERAREIVGIPSGTIRIAPSKTITDQYIVFVQSTSYNRKLLGSTKFLYEVSDWER